ncbi:MAG TPA: glycine zipper 2TM domain-containing protein [Dyella sp.]
MAAHASHEVCHNVEVQDQPKDQHQIAGMAIGAVGGGLLGHQIGGGKGKTLATVGGAVAGGYAGKKVQENQQAKHTHIERRCHEVED